MKLPRNWEDYKESVLQRTKTLCRAGIWTITEHDLYSWVNNFNRDEHLYLGLHILDSAIFRSDKMFQSAYSRFLMSNYRNLTVNHHINTPQDIKTWAAQIARQPRAAWTKKLLICPVKKSQDSGDSGDRVIRLLTSELINQSLVKVLRPNSWAKIKGYLILLVDDFVGSGNQFLEFAEQINLATGAQDNEIVYAPLMALKNGVDEINKKNIGIQVSPIEIVDKPHSIFYGKEADRFRNDQGNTIADALTCYEDIRKEYRIQMGSDYWMGHNNAAMSIAFQWGCPNQTLGILYKEQDQPRWRRLFKRRA